MKILKTQEDLTTYKATSNFPALLITEILKSLALIEEVREAIPSARACVILLDSEYQKAKILKNYGINNFVSEICEEIDLGTEKWRREVYVIDDAGDGVIIFHPVLHRTKFDTK